MSHPTSTMTRRPFYPPRTSTIPSTIVAALSQSLSSLHFLSLLLFLLLSPIIANAFTPNLLLPSRCSYVASSANSVITSSTTLPFSFQNKNNNNSNHGGYKDHRLYSLKPAAIPLMESGKALARSGELLIDLTSSLDIYGGSLSAMGANVRNCGDCIAQAAASCRFKTGVELVTDELREGADCLKEGTIKLQSAVQESEVDGKTDLMLHITNMIPSMKLAAYHLEEAGASLMKREKVDALGVQLILCGEALGVLSAKILDLSSLENQSYGNGGTLSNTPPPGKISSQRMMYASEQMILAGKELTTEGNDNVSTAKGKSWIKQGR